MNSNDFRSENVKGPLLQAQHQAKDQDERNGPQIREEPQVCQKAPKEAMLASLPRRMNNIPFPQSFWHCFLFF